MYFDLTQMNDFSIPAAWEDVKLAMRHLTNIRKLAIAGNEKWQKMPSNYSNYLHPAEVKFFPETETAVAQSWIEY